MRPAQRLELQRQLLVVRAGLQRLQLRTEMQGVSRSLRLSAVLALWRLWRLARR